MPGIVKEIGYAFLVRDSLPRWRWQADWEWEKIPYDWVCPVGVRARNSKARQFCEPTSIFVAYIKYQDMFTRRVHTSRMGMYLHQDPLQNPDNRAGGDTWNAWD